MRHQLQFWHINLSFTNRLCRIFRHKLELMYCWYSCFLSVGICGGLWNFKNILFKFMGSIVSTTPNINIK